MATYTTEIASDQLTSDNPIHQRLLKAYFAAQPYIKGDLLEVGCGEGRGVELLAPLADSYLALDKITEVIEKLSKKYDNVHFQQAVVPPFSGVASNSFDQVVSFQVIEHIRDDKFYLEEIYRVLRPGGKAIISTPNIQKTLSRNPWHIREYTPATLTALCQSIFDKTSMKGIAGNEKVMSYYERNKASVQKIMRFDILNLQYHLPAVMLRWPYEILNRMNRNKLNNTNQNLVAAITHEDYFVTDNAESALDLFVVVEKS